MLASYMDLDSIAIPYVRSVPPFLIQAILSVLSPPRCYVYRRWLGHLCYLSIDTYFCLQSGCSHAPIKSFLWEVMMR